MKKNLLFITLVSLAGCSGVMNGQTPLGAGLPGLGGSGSPGTINPSQVLSMGEDLYKAATLSDEDVKKVADESIAEMDSKNPVAPANNPYAQRLKRLSADLENAEGLNLDFKVYLVKDINAFSLPNGSIRVFAALMDRMTDDELKFILGHEIAHIKNGHRKARLQRAYASSAAIKAANTAVKATTSSNVGGVAAVLGGDIAAKIAGQVINGQFSQSDETECDEYGLHLLASKNLPKDAAVKALMKLGDDAGAQTSSTDLFASLTSSHPDPLDRAKHIEAMIPELAGQPDLVSSKVQVAKADTGGTAPVLPTIDQQVQAQGGQTNRSASQPKTMQVVPPTSEVVIERDHAPQERHQSGWYVQVGAFSNKSSATSLHKDVAKGSPQATTQPGVVSGVTVYRVLVGPFDSRSQAEQGRGRMISHDSGLSGAFVRHL